MIRPCFRFIDTARLICYNTAEKSADYPLFNRTRSGAKKGLPQMKKMLSLLLLCVLLLPCLSVAAEENADPYALPLDIKTGGFKPDPACITEDGYQDESLTIHKETRRYNNVTFHLVWVQIKSPTQLRTAVAGKPNETVTAKPSRMARKLNAVFACNGEFYVQRTRDIFVYRQGVMYRNEPDPIKDVLIIDEKGDFHIFTSENKKADIEAYLENGGTIVNAFSFGPALIVDGVEQDVHEFHLFDGLRPLPRTVIAQVDELSYVFVRCEGRKNTSRGCNHQQMADFMNTLNVRHAYNLDGGQSSVLILNGKYADDTTSSSERDQSDIIYVVSAVDPDKKGQ